MSRNGQRPTTTTTTWRRERPSARAFSTRRRERPSARTFSTRRRARPSARTFSRPDRPQVYVHVDLNFTSMSTSILRPCRPQFYVHFDLNFTSNSISIFLWFDVCISQNKAANATPPHVVGFNNLHTQASCWIQVDIFILL